MMSCMQECSSHAVLIEDMSLPFISNKWETAMTSQGHMTTASLKQANKEDNREVFFIRLHLKKVLRIDPLKFTL